jgi:hypothetical protein
MPVIALSIPFVHSEIAKKLQFGLSILNLNFSEIAFLVEIWPKKEL